MVLALVRVRFHIIRNARIENVGKSQSCMFSKLRIIWKQTVLVAVGDVLLTNSVGPALATQFTRKRQIGVCVCVDFTARVCGVQMAPDDSAYPLRQLRDATNFALDGLHAFSETAAAAAVSTRTRGHCSRHRSTNRPVLSVFLYLRVFPTMCLLLCPLLTCPLL